MLDRDHGNDHNKGRESINSEVLIIAKKGNSKVTVNYIQLTPF